MYSHNTPLPHPLWFSVSVTCLASLFKITTLSLLCFVLFTAICIIQYTIYSRHSLYDFFPSTWSFARLYTALTIHVLPGTLECDFIWKIGSFLM